jgi:hypothetical protein
MTTPDGTPWPLRPVLRFTAVAMILAVGAYLSTGTMQAILMVCSVGLAVVAAVNLAKHLRRPR